MPSVYPNINNDKLRIGNSPAFLFGELEGYPTKFFKDLWRNRYKIVRCEDCGIPYVRNKKKSGFTVSGKQLCHSCAEKRGKRQKYGQILDEDMKKYLTEKRTEIFFRYYEPCFQKIKNPIAAYFYDKYRQRIMVILAKNGFLEDDITEKTKFRQGVRMAQKYIRKACKGAKYLKEKSFTDLGLRQKRVLGLSYCED